EMATAVRLERNLGITLKRGFAGTGADFRDHRGVTWDAMGSEVTDDILNYEGFIRSLERKLANRAADRIVVDLGSLGPQNVARVRDFVYGLDKRQQARITILTR